MLLYKSKQSEAEVEEESSNGRLKKKMMMKNELQPVKRSGNSRIFRIRYTLTVTFFSSTFGGGSL